MFETELGCNEIGVDGIKVLAETMKKTQSIVQFDFSQFHYAEFVGGNSLSVEGATIFAEMLINNTSLAQLDLSMGNE